MSSQPPQDFKDRSTATVRLARKYISDLQTLPKQNQTTLLIDVMGTLLHKLLDERDARTALAARVKALEETAGGFNYRGVWREGSVYNKGAFVTHQGGLWHANEANAVRPGDVGATWTLAVKRGKDAR